ncbi:MAG TPA: tetratricopeptide repeat protein [Candidatus Polarisedimenticolia bacterium]|jgi:Flp pilus assembly protein TadD|nr:tetratricopeptide repeat protein [Candidatus Polarisedimenticolia bacterium]
MMKRTHHAPTGAAALVLGLGLAAAPLTGCTDKKTPVETSSSRTENTQPSVTSTPSTESQVAEVQGPPAPVTPAESIDPKTAWKEGVQSYQSGDFATASSQLRIAVDSRQDDPYAHYLFGLALWKSGQLDEAEGEMVRSTTLNDQSIKTWINLARVRLDRKEFDSALEAADKAVSIDGRSSDALHQRGRALDGLNRGDEAVVTLQQARSLSPDNGYIANTLGYLLLRRGQTEEAVPLLEAARDRLPQVAYVRNNLGVAYERQGDVHKAAEEFRAALQAGDSEGKASSSLARIEPLLRERIASQPLPEEQNPTDQPQN